MFTPATLLVAPKCCCCIFFASKRNATYVCNSLLYPTEFFNPLPRVCTDGRSTLTSKTNFLASRGMASRNIEGRHGQPKYSYEKAIYVVMISFALDFFFWIDRLLVFFYVWGSAACASRARTLC